MYWCLSAQSFACVCSLSQPGGVCKAEWCPFVCVLSKSVCGEEYRGKVYALLVSTPGASHVLLVPPLRTSSTSTFGFDFKHPQAHRYRKNYISKRNKKQVQVLSLQVSLHNFWIAISCMLMCGSVGCESLLRT